MSNLNKLWLQYNQSAAAIAKELNRTKNIVGEYAEHLACQYYKGKLTGISCKSHDLVSRSGEKIQVKSRKVDRIKSTSLNVIRSWAFNYLVVILFDDDGRVLKAIQLPRNVAKKLSRENDHQGGDILTTNKKLLLHKDSIDITDALIKIQNKS